MVVSQKVDFHIHTTVSDGTDSPAELLNKVKAAGLTHFAVTDHDAVKGCLQVKELLSEGDPCFIFGAEFSCEDEQGKYHVLGYGYDQNAAPLRELVETSHDYRVNRVKKRLAFLEREFGFSLSEKESKELFSLSNPGKPHIAGYMIKHGYATTITEAFRRYLDKYVGDENHIRPEQAIDAILRGGGIPVLAHPSFGSGNQLIVGEEMERRLVRFISFGLKGVEAFYSEFSPALQREVLAFADKYDLYVTAGSDYHGTNKTVRLGHTNLESASDVPRGFTGFLQAIEASERT